MTTANAGGLARADIVRGGATWFGYLALGYYTYACTSQGNIVPFLRDELSLTYAVVSLHASALAFGILLVALVADRVVARFGRKRTLMVSLAGSATAMTVLAFAPTAAISIGSCFLIGLIGGFIPAITSALLSDIHGNDRDLALTEANALCYVFAIAAPVLVALAVWLGLSWRVVPLAGSFAAIVIFVVYRRTEVPDGAARAPDSSRAPLSPAYWGYWALLGLGVALEFSGLLWAPSYLEQVVGLSPSAAALGAGTFFLAMLIGRVAGIRLLKKYAARSIFFGMVALIAVGFVGYWLAAPPALAVAGLFCIGLGVSLFFPLGISFAMTAAGPAASSRASSRSMLAPSLAVMLNPPLLGAIADNAGLWFAQVMIPVFLALAVVAFLVAQRLETR